ncbi:hypothetical protein GW17_00038401 [Ensete ventricosum]|nr:hypothetical protein GW17_00038401 [Ensete ventricosum]
MIRSAGEDSYVNSSRTHATTPMHPFPYLETALLFPWLTNNSSPFSTSEGRITAVVVCPSPSHASLTSKLGKPPMSLAGSDARPSVNRRLETSTGADHEPPQPRFPRALAERRALFEWTPFTGSSPRVSGPPPPPPVSGLYCSPHHHRGAEKSNPPEGERRTREGVMRLNGEISYVRDEEENENDSVALISLPPPPLQKLVVGYALTSKKVNSFLQPKLEGLAK